MVRNKPAAVWIVVLACVALVVVPVFLPGEVARWYIAAGARSLEAGDEESAQRLFKKAAAWDPDSNASKDYYWAQLQRRGLSPQERFRFIRDLLNQYSDNSGPALFFGDEFAWQGEFELAQACVKLGLPSKELADPTLLNQRAYFFALAGKELETALRDIEKAKKLVPGEPALEDTHAWVLHQMGRDLEALGYANIAIKALEPDKTEKANAEKSSSKSSSATSDDQEHGSSSGDSQATSGIEAISLRQLRSQIGAETWSLGVLHFHRLRIAEALDQPDIVAKDRQWLLRHGMPVSDLLF